MANFIWRNLVWQNIIWRNIIWQNFVWRNFVWRNLIWWILGETSFGKLRLAKLHLANILFLQNFIWRNFIWRGLPVPILSLALLNMWLSIVPIYLQMFQVFQLFQMFQIYREHWGQNGAKCVCILNTTNIFIETIHIMCLFSWNMNWKRTCFATYLR